MKTVEEDDFFGAPKAKPAPVKIETKPPSKGLFGDVAEDILAPGPEKPTIKAEDDLAKKGSVLAALGKEEKKEEPAAKVCTLRGFFCFSRF